MYRTLAIVLAVFAALPAAHAQDRIGPLEPYTKAAEALELTIRRELDDKAIDAMLVVLVDRDRIVWARGFGHADVARRVPATAETIGCVGSVSKLFTDIAVMQLVERGALDLDAPVTTYLPDFRPRDPDDKPITLRHLMAHRSGLVREPPVGSYFDPTAPGLEQTVRSLNDTALVYEPGTRTKYSNAAIATLGRILEVTQGEPFNRYIKKAVLDPIGMTSSRFALTPAVRERLAGATMWTDDGRTFPAPTFPLGIGPAGDLHADAVDLGRFLLMLLAEGQGARGRVLKPETLKSMYEVQFDAGRSTGFGLGFRVEGQGADRTVGHGGAVYGFATELIAAPEQALGAAVVATKDCANGVSSRIARRALEAMRDARAGRSPTVPEPGRPIAPERARELAGRYVGPSTVDLIATRSGLLLRAGIGPRYELRAFGDELGLDGPFVAAGPRLRANADRLTFNGAEFLRVPVARPDPSPERWRGLIGEYGWDHNILYILEDGGRLHARIEWFFDYPLTELGPDAFAFPDSGLYEGERLVFRCDEAGRASAVEAAGVVFPRRAIGGEDGSTFRITPIRPVAELRAESLRAEPPREPGDLRVPDLVELTSLDPTIRLDIRYATDDNFAGTPFYSSARAFLQRPAAEALVKAHRTLGELGFGLWIHDAYRPWYVTRMFWEATPPASRAFVADPARGSKHNRGCAVDLTLYDRATGRPVAMVGGYDEFSGRSNPDYPGGTARQRWHRDLLRRVMEANGFTVNDVEWWHFDHKDWPQYPLGNKAFEERP